MLSSLVGKIILTEKINDYSFLERKGKIYTFLNPVSYLDALRHKALFEQFDGVFADGSLLVAAIRLVYGERVTRRSCDMTSIGKELLERSASEGKTIYYVASRQAEIEKAVLMFRERFPNVKIAGYRNGYFNDETDMAQEVAHIVDVNPDFLVVGMGAIKQEEFLLKVKAAGFRGVGFTCGGFIHQTAHNKTDFYPEWVDRMNLRFLYRMYKEPHTRKRYVEAGLLFPMKFILERLFG